MNDVESTVRGPGRPPKQTGMGLKKGKSSWKPASVLDVVGKEEGYRYRWSNKSPDNLAKKHAEGWETISGLTGDKSKHIDADRISDAKQMASTHEKHDCILQRIPEELAQERDAYFSAENERRIAGLTAHIKKDIEKEGGKAHGSITVSSRMGERVIE